MSYTAPVVIASVIAMAAAGSTLAHGASSGMGEWLDDADGLPAYRYDGPLPATAQMRDGTPARLPGDPYFLLGNHRLTLFVHASGRYQILTGERAWARMNQGDEQNTGANDASIEIDGARTDLVGASAPAAVAATKHFGVGFARYEYALPSHLSLTRTLSVRPSASPGSGEAAFVVHITVRNSGPRAMRARYHEDVRAAFATLRMEGAVETTQVRYVQRVTLDRPAGAVRADTKPVTRLPLAFGRHGAMSRLDGEPPSLFLFASGFGAGHAGVVHEKDASSHDRLGVEASLEIPAQAERSLAFVVAVGRAQDQSALARVARDLVAAASVPHGPQHPSAAVQGGAFGGDWARLLPRFDHDRDAARRREMRWNAAVLEAMATYRAYYGETVVPQGTVYDYMWGLMASSRDLAQHALPLCHTDRALAHSVLRFLMKRMRPDGEVELNDQGFGWSTHEPMQTSDQQLYLFMLLAEYLRATKDVSVLVDDLPYYPIEAGAHGTGLDRVRQAFCYMRDRVGAGSHGLMRLWNSDWNDAFYFWAGDVPYNRMFATAESHMNTAMAVVVLGDLADQLAASGSDQRLASHRREIGDLVDAFREYRTRLLSAFMKDWGARAFPRRIYVQDEQAVGADTMWLEPQAFTLLIPEVRADRRAALLSEIDARLMKGEALGARQIESPEAHPGWEVGSRENGGFWYALNGPLILGVGTFDHARAEDLLQQMSFAHFAQRFPTFWAGQWSASDTIESSLIASEGLPDQTWTFADVPVYCAHAHAWPLYCYLRLREQRP